MPPDVPWGLRLWLILYLSNRCRTGVEKGAFFASKRRHLLLSKTLIGPSSFAVIVRGWARVAGALRVVPNFGN